MTEEKKEAYGLPDLWPVKGVGDVPRVYLEAWGFYEAFRKLGYEDEQIETRFAPGFMNTGKVATRVERMIHVILVAEGKEFSCTVGYVGEEFEEAERIHYGVRQAIADGTIGDVELEEIWKRSSMGKEEMFLELVSGVLEKGFDPPALQGQL